MRTDSVVAVHSHHWDCRPYEAGITRGQCTCGQVRYFATWWPARTDGDGAKLLARLEELNEKETTVNNDLTPMIKPDNWVKMTTNEQGDWYNQNKAQISADAKELGVMGCVAKWGMSPRTLRDQLKRWAIVPPTEQDRMLGNIRDSEVAAASRVSDAELAETARQGSLDVLRDLTDLAIVELDATDHSVATRLLREYRRLLG